MSARPVGPKAVAATAVVLVTAWLIVAAASNRAHPPAALPRPPPRLASTTSVAAPTVGCSDTVDDTDPLAAATAAALWLYCGTGPAGLLTTNGQQVVAAWLAQHHPDGAAFASAVAFVDPRSSPVVVSVMVRQPPDPAPQRVLVTLFLRSPAGGWEVDDLAVAG